MKLSRRKFLAWLPALWAARLTRRIKPLATATAAQDDMSVPTAVPTAIGQEPPRQSIYLPFKP